MESLEEVRSLLSIPVTDIPAAVIPPRGRSIPVDIPIKVFLAFRRQLVVALSRLRLTPAVALQILPDSLRLSVVGQLRLPACIPAVVRFNLR